MTTGTRGQAGDGAAAVRVFVAIELPEGIRAALEAMQQRLAAARLPLRLVRPEGIHLTLAFIGDIPTAQVPVLRGAVAQAAAGVPVFTLRAEGLGMFPNARRPRVVWAGVQGDPEDRARLTLLHGHLAAALRAAGFTSDPRFDPHLTLGRVHDRVTPADLAAIGPAVQAQALPSGLTFDVAHVSIMRSELRPSGAVYTRLDAVPLTPETRNEE
jgi:2'-5' RNA ligase